MGRTTLAPNPQDLPAESRSQFAKRALDLAVAIPAAFLLSPLFIAIAVWIKLDSRGPVFFLQERVGQFGRLFRIIKFRTMTVYTEDQRRILSLKPGLTSSASIAFSDESKLLARQEDPEGFYLAHLAPAKIREDLNYARRATVFSDCALVVKTLFRILFSQRMTNDQ